jgi:hypothetical protein
VPRSVGARDDEDGIRRIFHRNWEDQMGSRLPRAGIAGLAVLLFAALIAQPASAHTVSSGSKVVYSDAGLCVIGKADLTANHATGGMTPAAWTNARRVGSGCDTIDVFEPGHVAVQADLQYWNGSSWLTCQTGRAVTNPEWNWEAMVSTPNDTSPCGRAYYRTVATSSVWDGSTWRSGTTTSPYHPPVP